MNNELKQAAFIAMLGVAILAGMVIVFLTNFN
jgi:hypothetical protein